MDPHSPTRKNVGAILILEAVILGLGGVIGDLWVLTLGGALIVGAAFWLWFWKRHRVPLAFRPLLAWLFDGDHGLKGLPGGGWEYSQTPGGRELANIDLHRLMTERSVPLREEAIGLVDDLTGGYLLTVESYEEYHRKLLRLQDIARQISNEELSWSVRWFSGFAQIWADYNAFVLASQTFDPGRTPDDAWMKRQDIHTALKAIREYMLSVLWGDQRDRSQLRDRVLETTRKVGVYGHTEAVPVEGGLLYVRFTDKDGNVFPTGKQMGPQKLQDINGAIVLSSRVP